MAQSCERSEVKVFDASWYLPAQQRDAEQEFLTAHIPGAQRFDFDQRIRDDASALPHMLPPAKILEQHLRALGINNEDTVIVYDGMGLFAAPRAWWMLRAAGLSRVSVLDGGLPAWRSAELSLASGPAQEVRRGNVNVADPGNWLVTCAQVQRALDDPNCTLLDARPSDRFDGTAPEPRAGLRSGHMPGAVNLPVDRLVIDGHLRSARELADLFDQLAPRTSRLICTCGSGVTAAIIALAATVAGRTNVAVYDGSWAEWGQPGPLPVQTVMGH